MLPRPEARILTYVGKAMEFPKIDEPSREDVAKWHAKSPPALSTPVSFFLFFPTPDPARRSRTLPEATPSHIGKPSGRQSVQLEPLAGLCRIDLERASRP